MPSNKQNYRLKDIDWEEVKTKFIDTHFILSITSLIFVFIICTLFWDYYLDKYKNILKLLIFVYECIIITPRIKIEKSYKQKGKIFIFIFFVLLLFLIRAIILKNSSEIIAELTYLLFQLFIVLGTIAEGLDKNLIKPKKRD